MIIHSSQKLFGLLEELLSEKKSVHLCHINHSCRSNFVKFLQPSGEFKILDFDKIFSKNGKITKNDTFSLEDKIITELKPYEIKFSLPTYYSYEKKEIALFFGTNPEFLYKAPTLDFQKKMAKFFMGLYPTSVYGSLGIMETIQAVKNAKVCITVVNSVPHICALFGVPHIVLVGPSAYQQDIFFKKSKVLVSGKDCDFRPCYSANGDGFCGGCMDNFDFETINLELKRLVNFDRDIGCRNV